MSITIICAASKNNVIGQDNTIPWYDPKDLAYFSKVTKNGILIMGRKTYESLPNKKLPNRIHIVITSQPDIINTFTIDPEVIAVSSFGEAVETARLFGLCSKDVYSDNVFVIGGAAVIKAAIPVANKWLLTRVETEVSASPTNVVVESPDPNIWTRALDVSKEVSGFGDLSSRLEVYLKREGAKR